MPLQSVFTDLVRFQIELWNAVDARLRSEAGVTLGSYETLAVLTRRGACRVQDIADDLIVTVGGTSKLVDRVEALGLCQRRANPLDRRSSLVELTPEGVAAHRHASIVVDSVLAERLGDVLTPEALGGLAATLRTLRGAPPRTAGAAAAPAPAAALAPPAPAAVSAPTVTPTPARKARS